MQVVIIGLLYAHPDQFARRRYAIARNMDQAVYLRGIGIAAAHGPALAGRIYQHLQATAHLLLQPRRADAAISSNFKLDSWRYENVDDIELVVGQ